MMASPACHRDGCTKVVTEVAGRKGEIELVEPAIVSVLELLRVDLHKALGGGRGGRGNRGP